METKKQFSTIDEYINTCPDDVQGILKKIKEIIQKNAPDVQETISYKMPAFNLNGKCLVYFAAWKDHIAIYPIPAATGVFQKELLPYIGGKGTVRIPLNKPVPYDLVEKIVKSRMKQSLKV